MRAALLLVGFACCLAAAPARAQTTVEMAKCGDTPLMGHELAIQYCTRAIKSGVLSNRLLGTAHFNRAVAWAARGDVDRAIDDFTESMRIDAILPEPDYWRAAAFIHRGTLFSMRQQNDRALADLAEAARLDPSRAEVYFRRGQVWAAKRDPDAALADYAEALRHEIGGNTFYASASLALQGRRQRERAEYESIVHLARAAAFMQKSNSDAALDALAEAMKRTPENALAFGYRGVVRESRGDLDGAIADYTEVVRLNPKDAEAYHRRGAAWLAKGDEARAKADLETAAKLKADVEKNRPRRFPIDLDRRAR